jgi:hypothetical protein
LFGDTLIINTIIWKIRKVEKSELEFIHGKTGNVCIDIELDVAV